MVLGHRHELLSWTTNEPPLTTHRRYRPHFLALFSDATCKTNSDQTTTPWIPCFTCSRSLSLSFFLFFYLQLLLQVGSMLLYYLLIRVKKCNAAAATATVVVSSSLKTCVLSSVLYHAKLQP
jgi:hypothetical protein